MTNSFKIEGQYYYSFRELLEILSMCESHNDFTQFAIYLNANKDKYSEYNFRALHILYHKKKETLNF